MLHDLHEPLLFDNMVGNHQDEGPDNRRRQQEDVTQESEREETFDPFSQCCCNPVLFLLLQLAGVFALFGRQILTDSH